MALTAPSNTLTAQTVSASFDQLLYLDSAAGLVEATLKIVSTEVGKSAVQLDDERLLVKGVDTSNAAAFDVQNTGGTSIFKVNASTAGTTTIGTVTVGVNDTGHDVTFFGATSGKKLLWDESADELVLIGNGTKLSFYDAAGGENISADASGVLSIAGGTEIDLTATTIDINGTVPDLTLSGNITMADDTSIGIGDSSERIEFDGAGDISLLGCNVGIGTATPSATGLGSALPLLHIRGTQPVIVLDDSSGGGKEYGLASEVTKFRIMDDGTPRLTINTDGNVGIGTDDPDTHLHLAGTNPVVTFEHSSDWYAGNVGGNFIIGISGGSYASNTIFNIIADGGNVGIGTATPGFGDDGDEAITNAAGLLEIAGTGADTAGPTLVLRQTATDIHATGDYVLGMIKFAGNDIYSTEDGVGAMIISRAIATWNGATNDYPTDFEVWTNIDGAAAMAKRFTVKSDGDFVGSANAGISDERLKTNITSLTGSLDKINQLRGVSFTWKPEAVKNVERVYLGLLAQEVEEYFPDSVRDESVCDTEDITYKSIEYTSLIAPIIQAIQELSAEVEKLKGN